MEVLKISDSKLKIMLTRADMQKFNLKADNIDYNDTSVKRSFWEILDKVKQTHSFDTEGDKVLIQFYPSKDGGCELFVTKLGLLPTASERAISKSDRVTMLATRRLIYKFSDLRSLLLGIRQIAAKKNAKYSEVFVDESGEYYLEIMERGAGKCVYLSEFEHLLEFSERVDRAFYPYITEHCKKLTSGNAIELFTAL